MFNNFGKKKGRIKKNSSHYRAHDKTKKDNIRSKILTHFMRFLHKFIEINFEAQTDTRDLFERCAGEIEGAKTQNIVVTLKGLHIFKKFLHFYRIFFEKIVAITKIV